MTADSEASGTVVDDVTTTLETSGERQDTNGNESETGSEEEEESESEVEPEPPNPNYFISPSDDTYFLCCVFLAYYLATVYAPNTIPWFLGPIAQIAKDLSRNYNPILKIVLFGATVVHIAEGFYAVVLCRQKRINLVPTIKWWIQTTILGYFSLRLLLKHGNAGGKKKK